MSRKSWRLSSSNLRICLKVFRSHEFQQMMYIGQFQWLEMEGSWYLYNSRSQLILASVRYHDGKYLVRYRPKSRYKHIIEEWIASDTTGNLIAMESAHVGRWERRMYHIRYRDQATRGRALYTYFTRLMPDFKGEVISDKITNHAYRARTRNNGNNTVYRDELVEAAMQRLQVQGFNTTGITLPEVFTDTYEDAEETPDS